MAVFVVLSPFVALKIATSRSTLPSLYRDVTLSQQSCHWSCTGEWVSASDLESLRHAIEMDSVRCHALSESDDTRRFCDVQISAFGEGSYRQKSLILPHSWAILARFNAVFYSHKRAKGTSMPTPNCWPPRCGAQRLLRPGAREPERWGALSQISLR